MEGPWPFTGRDEELRTVEVETFNAGGDRAAREVAVQLTWRVVATA